ncbi:MAG TPA: amidase family protein, partial [Candidatus Sulfotelmatobacter sp.]|nr:amidase family protein [Candidatus Sulfotelmatobacter sp.]
LELRRRAEAYLTAAQRRAAVAVLLGEPTLAAGFASAPPGSQLRGVPYLIKDLFDVAGLPTFAGSSFLPEARPTPAVDSQMVRELRAAGAVLAGKTHLFEFAWGLTGENAHYGDCEHPRFPGRTSGGSSSGSAAAVAADVVPFAIGTDTGGSIRVPAAFCGIFGYRGVPRAPWISDAFPLAPDFDTAGWFTGSASDMRDAIAALVGLRAGERTPRGCYLDMPGLDPDVSAACAAAAAALAPAADRFSRGELLQRFAPAAEIYGVLAGTQAWRIHKKWADRYRGRYGPLVQDRLDRAREISPAQVAAVEPSYAALRFAWAEFFKANDFLVMAATPFPALAKADCTQATRLRMLGLTAPASLGGLPALTIPVPLASGMSAGLQIIVNDPQSPVIPWALGLQRRSDSLY